MNIRVFWGILLIGAGLMILGTLETQEVATTSSTEQFVDEKSDEEQDDSEESGIARDSEGRIVIRIDDGHEMTEDEYNKFQEQNNL